MSGRLSVVLVFLFALSAVGFVAAQSPVDVLYVQQNSSILTYNVNPQTLQATLVGPPLEIPSASDYVSVYPSPNDHFVYVLTRPPQSSLATIAVYATNAQGVPQTPRVEAIGPAPISSFAIDPNGLFAYTVTYEPIVSSKLKGYSTYKLRLYMIDSATGKLTRPPQILDSYNLSSDCGPYFVSFNASGSQVIESMSCGYPDSSSATYFSRTVSNTGQLGRNIPIFTVNDALGSVADEVTFNLNTIVDLREQVNPFQVSILVYPANAYSSTPTIDCTSSMLPACGEAGSYVPDATGNFLVLELGSSSEIVKVDLGSKQITETGSTLPGSLQPFFSPDDAILYGLDYQPNSTSIIQIYGFNPNTGGLTSGGQIAIDGLLGSIYPATRH